MESKNMFEKLSETDKKIISKSLPTMISYNFRYYYLDVYRVDDNEYVMSYNEVDNINPLCLYNGSLDYCLDKMIITIKKTANIIVISEN